MALGTLGTGKSTVLNTILGEERFAAKMSIDSVTQNFTKLPVSNVKGVT